MRFGRQRRSRRRPRQVVLIDAGIAVVALAHRGQQIHRQFERGQTRFLAELLRGQLVDRGSQVVVAALGPLGFRRAEVRGIRRRVRAGVGVPQFEVVHHGAVIANVSQRRKRRRQLGEVLPRQVPHRPVSAHGNVKEAQAARRSGQRGGGRRHGIQQRKRQRSSQATKKGSARQRFAGHDHCVLLISNGVLLTIPKTRDEKW